MQLTLYLWVCTQVQVAMHIHVDGVRLWCDQVEREFPVLHIFRCYGNVGTQIKIHEMCHRVGGGNIRLDNWIKMDIYHNRKSLTTTQVNKISIFYCTSSMSHFYDDCAMVFYMIYKGI